jgi:ParB family transcriptional regulator, chromosome partitioning protein
MPMPTPKQALKPIDWLREGQNSRKIEINDGIKELCHSIVANGLLQPIGAIDHGDHGEVIYGFRRLAAIRYGLSAGLAVPDKIPTLLYPPSTTPSQVRVINLTENVQRVDLSEPEIYLSCVEIMKLNPEWARKDLAAHLGKDPSTATKWLCPDDLVPEAKEAFLAGKFGFSKAYAIAKLSPAEQPGLLALTLGGATRDELESQGRKRRAASTPAVRASKIRISLTSGATVTVSGDDLSLDDAIEAVKDAAKEMTKGREMGLDSKTIQAVARDKAKAG